MWDGTSKVYTSPSLRIARLRAALGRARTDCREKTTWSSTCVRTIISIFPSVWLERESLRKDDAPSFPTQYTYALWRRLRFWTPLNDLWLVVTELWARDRSPWFLFFICCSTMVAFCVPCRDASTPAPSGGEILWFYGTTLAVFFLYTIMTA